MSHQCPVEQDNEVQCKLPPFSIYIKAPFNLIYSDTHSLEIPQGGGHDTLI